MALFHIPETIKFFCNNFAVTFTLLTTFTQGLTIFRLTPKCFKTFETPSNISPKSHFKTRKIHKEKPIISQNN